MVQGIRVFLEVLGGPGDPGTKGIPGGQGDPGGPGGPGDQGFLYYTNAPQDEDPANLVAQVRLADGRWTTSGGTYFLVS